MVVVELDDYANSVDGSENSTFSMQVVEDDAVSWSHYCNNIFSYTNGTDYFIFCGSTSLADGCDSSCYNYTIRQWGVDGSIGQPVDQGLLQYPYVLGNVFNFGGNYYMQLGSGSHEQVFALNSDGGLTSTITTDGGFDGKTRFSVQFGATMNNIAFLYGQNAASSSGGFPVWMWTVDSSGVVGGHRAQNGNGFDQYYQIQFPYTVNDTDTVYFYGYCPTCCGGAKCSDPYWFLQKFKMDSNGVDVDLDSEIVDVRNANSDFKPSASETLQFAVWIGSQPYLFGKHQDDGAGLAGTCYLNPLYANWIGPQLCSTDSGFASATAGVAYPKEGSTSVSYVFLQTSDLHYKVLEIGSISGKKYGPFAYPAGVVTGLVLGSVRDR